MERRLLGHSCGGPWGSGAGWASAWATWIGLLSRTRLDQSSVVQMFNSIDATAIC